MKSPEYLLVVNHASIYGVESIRDLLKIPAYADLRVIVLTNNPKKYAFVAEESYPSEIIECQFASAEEIKAALAPFKDHIRAVICRGEKNIQYFRMVIPHLPPHVLTATPEALEAATNKRLMREAFLRHAPEITPQFVQVHDASAVTLDKVEEKLAYPVIVKPANLASSLLIQACRNRDELKSALGNVFAVIADMYQRQERHDEPQVIVEEYLEGDFYSVDAYAMKPGEFYFCPVVGYVPAKQIGIDDFFLYKRFVPAALTGAEVTAANEAVTKALTAVGLTHSSAHVEMVLTKNGWKIIELGPRLGRFRHKIYKAAYGIDHSLNDVLIHLGQKPEIPTKLLQHCSAYSIYPEQEGILREIRGIESVQNNPMTQFLRIFAKPGDACVHAKNGGGPLAEFVIADKDATAFNKTVAFIEETVKPVVD